MKKNKVLLGMSGGIDSTAAAVILLNKGYDVTGLTFRIEGVTSDSIERAEEICEILGINHIYVDISKRFKEDVINYFINEYENGRTPNPCVKCNKNIKFGYIYNFAMEKGYDYVSTGHYAIIDEVNSRYYLKAPYDKKKDQTYFLYVLKEEQLKHILFPLGETTKDQNRKICAKYNLLPRESKESQEICFIKDDYKKYLKEVNAKNKKGNFVDEQGNILYPHNGIINYTVGQRKGLGFTVGKPIYVKNINSKTGDITVADNENLFTNKLTARDINLINGFIPQNCKLYAKIRYRAKKAEIKISINNDNTAYVEFKEKQRAITAGQSIVFYTDDHVVGGGIIEDTQY